MANILSDFGLVSAQGDEKVASITLACIDIFNIEINDIRNITSS